MQIDWTINLVGVGQIIVFVIGGLFFLFKTSTTVATVKEDFTNFKDEVKSEINDLKTAVATIAVAEERIAAVKSRFEDEKTDGFEFRLWVQNEIRSIWSAIRGQVTEIISPPRKPAIPQ